MSSSSSQMYGSGLHAHRIGSNMGGLSGLSGSGSYSGYGNVIHWGHNDWRNVVLPAVPVSHHYAQGMSYMVRGLDPDQHYEATVQSR